MPPANNLGHNAALALISRGRHAQNDYVARHWRLRRRPLAERLGSVWARPHFTRFRPTSWEQPELGDWMKRSLASDQRLRATSGARGAQPLLPFGGSLGDGISIRDRWRIPGLRPRPERPGIPSAAASFERRRLKCCGSRRSSLQVRTTPTEPWTTFGPLARMAGRVGVAGVRSYKRIEWIRRLASRSRAARRFLCGPSEDN